MKNSPDSRYRMVSWWLRWEDLAWPEPRLKDKIRIRADKFAANNADCAIIFGTHFRWDYMPLWSALHDMFHFIADELHQREIQFFDHHSAVLTHRWRTMEERNEMYLRNRHHVPFCPSRDIAGEWTWRGKRLNDWRMINTTTGEPVFIKEYTAEQYCINNPDFTESYCEYVKKLIAESGIDGLICDDAFFNQRFYQCACPHCQDKFGHILPAASDLNFWGNWENPLFLEWIQMRYRSVADFNHQVKLALPENFPLMNCCSGSTSSASNENALSYEEFARDATIVELEMCGNTPDLEGCFSEQIADQLHHLAVAEKYHLPCVGLGYAYTVPGANFIWALNKFLGSGVWFSMLTHRLGLSDADLNKLPDDPELVGECFGVETAYPEWFSGRRVGEVAILFSRNTRDNYGGYMADYSHDYRAACSWLFEHGYDADVVLDIPEPSAPYEALVLASAACLSAEERTALQHWLDAGKKIVACGPLGVFDGKGKRNPLFPDIHLPEIVRTPKFPHDTWEKVEPARCQNEYGWKELTANLLWHPQRMQDGLSLKMPFPGSGQSGWYQRKYRDAQGRLLIHCLSSKYDVEVDEALEAKRSHKNNNNIITHIQPKNQAVAIDLSLYAGGQIELFLPLNGGEVRLLSNAEFELGTDIYYFILRIGRKD